VKEWQTWWIEYGDEVMAQLEAEEAEREENQAAAIAAAEAKARRYKNHPRNPPTPPSSKDASETAPQPKPAGYHWAASCDFRFAGLSRGRFRLHLY
jgi:hypothetical protein